MFAGLMSHRLSLSLLRYFFRLFGYRLTLLFLFFSFTGQIRLIFFFPTFLGSENGSIRRMADPNETIHPCSFGSNQFASVYGLSGV